MDKINEIFSDFNIDFRRVEEKFNKLKSGIDFKNIIFHIVQKERFKEFQP